MTTETQQAPDPRLDEWEQRLNSARRMQLPAWVLEAIPALIAMVRERDAKIAEEDKVMDRDDLSPVEKAITIVWGGRCSEHQDGCPCCDAWAEYDRIRSAIEAAPSPDALVAAAYEAAARTVDCGCGQDQKARAVAAEAPNGGPRWMACGEANCGAIEAATIRALTPEDARAQLDAMLDNAREEGYLLATKDPAVMALQIAAVLKDIKTED